MIELCERPIMFELTQTAELIHWSGDRSDPAWVAFTGDVRRHIEAKRAHEVRLAPAPEQSAPHGERGGAPSLAILPFTNRSGLQEDEVFAEGMVEDLVAAMSHGFSVKVRAASATAGFRKGAYADISAVGRQLGVRYLLEGNVRRASDMLRVTTQVLEAETGEVLWSGLFDRPLSELARLQEDLVAEVFSTLEVRFQTLELQRALRKPADITAWEAVNRSSAAQRQSDSTSFMRAVEEAQRAIAIDPDYALAHAQFAQAMGVLYLYAMPDDPGTEQRIQQHVERALVLGSDDLTVVGLSSQALCCIGRPDEALAHMQRGVQKAPLVGPYHYNIGWACALLDRVDEGLSSMAAADRLMPDWAFQVHIRGWQANLMARSGKWAEAEELANQALVISPDYDAARHVNAAACLRTGRPNEARAIFSPVAQRGLPMEQVLTFTRRIYVNNPVADEISDAIRRLWPAAAS